MLVTKRSGVKEEFDISKIVKSCMAAGVDYSDALKIANGVKNTIENEETTAEIRAEVYKLLSKDDPEAAKKYIKHKKTKSSF